MLISLQNLINSQKSSLGGANQFCKCKWKKNVFCKKKKMESQRARKMMNEVKIYLKKPI